MHGVLRWVNTADEGSYGIRGAPRISISSAQRVVAFEILLDGFKDMSQGKVEIIRSFLKHELVDF